MTDKELDKIVDDMTNDQLKAYAKIGFLYAFRMLRKVFDCLAEKPKN